MIEVEKDFVLTGDQGNKLLAGAVLLEEKTNHDVYYDTPRYALGLKDIWLRSRNGSWELKYPVVKGSGINAKYTGMYHEVEKEPEILNFLKTTLGFPRAEAPSAFEDVIHVLGLRPFADFRTKRRSYEKEGFHIDFDETDFGLKITEIELMVEKPEELTATERRIEEFALRQGLQIGDNYGKVASYVKKFNPGAYAVLHGARVL